MLFWQISALDLESINVNFILQVVFCYVGVFVLYCCVFVVGYFCFGWGGVSHPFGAVGFRVRSYPQGS